MKTYLILLAAMLIATAALAGSIPTNEATQPVNVTIDRVTSVAASGPVTLTLTPPTIAGDAPVATDATTYLRYTSIILPTQTLGVGVNVKLDTAWLPTGTQLELTGMGAGSNKVGDVGFVLPLVLPLNTTNQPFIAAIGSGYTGTGSADGVNLSYKLSVSNWVTVRAGTGSGNVVFTITP
jgi:hypothetical protein